MENSGQNTMPGDSNLAVTPANMAETTPDTAADPDLADSAPAPAENGLAPMAQTNPEFPATPETEMAAVTDNAVTPPNNEISSDETCPSCPACPEAKCEEFTVDSPKFKELLKIYLSGFVLVRKAKRERNLQLILDTFTPQDKITNDRVQTLLKVSHRTATAYLSALFKQGKLMRFGTGRKTFYQKYG